MDLARAASLASLILVAAGCTSEIGLDEDEEEVGAADSALSTVDTERPFDARSCPGRPLSALDAATFVRAANEARHTWWEPRKRLVDGFDLWERVRECDEATGECTAWSGPRKLLRDFHGYRVDVVEGASGLQLVVKNFRGGQSGDCETMATCGAARGATATCDELPMATTDYRYGYMTCAKSEESIRFRLRVTPLCARVTASSSTTEGGIRTERRFAAVERVNRPCTSSMVESGSCPAPWSAH